jgi:hypothetical protein
MENTCSLFLIWIVIFTTDLRISQVTRKTMANVPRYPQNLIKVSLKVKTLNIFNNTSLVQYFLKLMKVSRVESKLCVFSFKIQFTGSFTVFFSFYLITIGKLFFFLLNTDKYPLGDQASPNYFCINSYQTIFNFPNSLNWL